MLSQLVLSVMKTALSLCLGLLALTPAQAQIFRSDAAHRHASRSHVSTPRGGDHIYRHSSGYRGHGHRPGYVYQARHFDRHYSGYRGSYGYAYVPSYGYYSGYGYGYPYYGSYGYYGSGSAAGTGLLLGALAGGIIGHNSGDFRHNGWRGAAWGAGAGWLLGSVIDANRRPVVYSNPAPIVVQQPAAVVQAPVQPAQAQPQQVTIINNYYGGSTPMSAVNGMFGR
jgi:hypothetical protein